MFSLVCVCVRAQKQVNSEEFGPTLADLEKQIAAHNIEHKEIEAYNSQLCVSSAGGKVTGAPAQSLSPAVGRLVLQAAHNVWFSHFAGRIHSPEKAVQHPDGELSGRRLSRPQLWNAIRSLKI